MDELYQGNGARQQDQHDSHDLQRQQRQFCRALARISGRLLTQRNNSSTTWAPAHRANTVHEHRHQHLRLAGSGERAAPSLRRRCRVHVVASPNPSVRLDAGEAVAPDLLNIHEVAALLRRSEKTIRRGVREGQIPAFRVLNGGPWLFRRADVFNLLAPVGVESNHQPAPVQASPATTVDWVTGITGADDYSKVNHGS